MSQKTVRKKPRGWSRLVLAIVVVAVFGAGVAYAWMPRPVEVDVGHVRRGPLEVWVSEDGRARVRERYTVSAPLSGTLVRLDWDPGDSIEAGAVVARLLPPDPLLLDARTRSEAEARLATALARNQQLETAVERAAAARDGALREVARGKALASESLISAAELERLELLARLSVRDVDAAELAHRVALAEVRAARATLGQVQSGRGQTIEVVAPASGRILLVHRESEGPVAAGTPLIDFGDPSSLELVIDVLSSDAARIRVGAPVRFRQWGETGERLGYVRLVEPAAFTHISALGVEEQRVNVIVSLEEPPSALGDGYRVEARILVWQGADIVVIPSSAVFRHDDDWATYGIEGGRAMLRRLKLGQRNLLDVEVREGIDAGARVVQYPGIRVEAGARVSAR